MTLQLVEPDGQYCHVLPEALIRNFHAIGPRPKQSCGVQAVSIRGHAAFHHTGFPVVDLNCCSANQRAGWIFHHSGYAPRLRALGWSQDGREQQYKAQSETSRRSFEPASHRRLLPSGLLTGTALCQATEAYPSGGSLAILCSESVQTSFASSPQSSR